MGADGMLLLGPLSAPIWPLVWPLIIAKPLQNHCKIVAKPDEGQTGPDGVADERIIYF
jgi:hypothetical protein